MCALNENKTCSVDYARLIVVAGEGSPGIHRTMRSPPIAVPWSPDSSQATSSNSSSPSSSAPNSPAAAANLSGGSGMGRPSSLHVARNKKTSSLKSPHRRKSVHNFPLSPLARTPSPSNMIQSPARSPSPLTGVQGHIVGSSHLPQQTIPAHLNPVATPPVLHTHPPPSHKQATHKQTFSGARPKSYDSGSPIAARARSPELLHPSSAEKLPVTHTLSAPGTEKNQGASHSRAASLRKASLQESKSNTDPP